MRPMHFAGLGFLVVCLIVGAGMVGWLKKTNRPDVTQIETQMITPAIEIGGPFKLTSHKGEPVNSEDYKGKLVLLYFGYTYCPDFCPTELQQISEALRLMGNKASEIQPFFISVDPERDTQEVLDRYMSMFHPSFLALTGQKTDLDDVAKSFRVFSARVEEDDASDYLIDHSTFVYLVGRDGKLITMFRYGTPAMQMAQALKGFLNQKPAAIKVDAA